MKTKTMTGEAFDKAIRDFDRKKGEELDRRFIRGATIKIHKPKRYQPTIKPVAGERVE